MLFRSLKELSPKLTYHNAWHTTGDVLPAAICFASKLNVNQDDLTVLKTAILFHDLGYLQQYDNNESIGAKMAEDILPQYEYSYEQIVKITRLILATQVPQKPTTLLEKIICDADLDSLHRDDFIERGRVLLAEFAIFQNNIKEFDWLDIQLEFIKNHTYHLDVDINSRNAGKLENILLLEKKIASLADKNSI